MSADVLILFSPLPEMPEPPMGDPDPRQTKFRRIIGALDDATGGSVHLSVANLETGYHASAPSLGVLKTAHEETLAHFDMRGVRDRWEKDLRRWLSSSLARWIQRTKQVEMKLYTNGIAVEIETQDDHGYYRYCFDLMFREAPAAESTTPPVE